MRWSAILGCFSLGLVHTWAGGGELASPEMVAARKLYLAKCAKCHEMYDPKAYADADWAGWLKKMGKKSKLKPEQFQALERYTHSLRKPAEAPPPPN